MSLTTIRSTAFGQQTLSRPAGLRLISSPFRSSVRGSRLIANVGYKRPQDVDAARDKVNTTSETPQYPQVPSSDYYGSQAQSAEEVNQFFVELQERWEKVEDKPRVVLYSVIAFLTVIFSNSLIKAVDSLPLLPQLLELVGTGVTGWFIYRYLLFAEGREDLSRDYNNLKDRIIHGVDDAKDDLNRIGGKVKEGVRDVDRNVTNTTEGWGKSIKANVEDAGRDAERIGDKIRSGADDVSRDVENAANKAKKETRGW